jgi:hypothetical protein
MRSQLEQVPSHEGSAYTNWWNHFDATLLIILYNRESSMKYTGAMKITLIPPMADRSADGLGWWDLRLDRGGGGSVRGL